MGLHYTNLDERTRDFMLREVDKDVLDGKLYISPRLNQRGQQDYETLLREAIRENDDDWLASQLRFSGYMNAMESRRKRGGGVTMAKVPVTAPDTLSEGEFNRFYVRGLCLRAIEDGIEEVEVYRGRASSRPRPESQAMIGKRVSARNLLEDLRNSQGVEPALGLPPGPNSGLTVRLA